MTTLDLINKLEKKNYPLWKIHSILSFYNVELKPILNVEEHASYVNSVYFKKNIKKAEKYINSLKNWDKQK